VLLAALVPVLQPLTLGSSTQGNVAEAEPGQTRLGLTQYVVEVAEGAKQLILTLENLNLGNLKLHVRYGSPVEMTDGRVRADWSSGPSGEPLSIALMGAQLKAGRYYITVENLEPYAQDFKLTATLTS